MIYIIWMYLCMNEWNFSDVWAPSNPLDFILLQDHTFKALHIQVLCYVMHKDIYILRLFHEKKEIKLKKDDKYVQQNENIDKSGKKNCS